MQTPTKCSRCGTVSDPGETFCGNCGQPLQATVTPAPQICPRCRSSVAAGETFCGNCGQSLSAAARPGPSVPYAPPPVAAPKRSSFGKIFLIGCLGLVVVSVLAAGGVGIYVWRRASYTPPDRKPPQLPQRTAGTMREFPVDTDPTAPAAPTSVATQSLTPDGPSGASSSGISSQTPLPPGLDRSTLARRADSMTTATYRPRQQTPTSTTAPANVPADSPPTAAAGGQVIVIVLNLLPNSGGAADALAAAVTQASGGQATGVQVQSPNGAIYTGSRIRTQQICVYILQKQDASVAIIVFAPDPGTQQMADRLAMNVGNGDGLNDYPDVKDSFSTLPAAVPSGLTIEEINTLTRNQIESLLAGPAGGGGEDVGRILEQMRNFIPDRLLSVRYSDTSRQEWNALSFEYGSTFQAWRTWLLARGALGLSGSQSTTVREVDALYLDQDGKRILIFQKGPYLVVLGGPSAVPLDRLVALGNQFQL